MLLKYAPDKAPTPSPAINLPIVICVSEKVVPVCTAVPTVKTADQIRIDPLLPKRSEVNAWPRAPTNVLHNFVVGVQKKKLRPCPQIGKSKSTLTQPIREKLLWTDENSTERIRPLHQALRIVWQNPAWLNIPVGCTFNYQLRISSALQSNSLK